MKNKNLSQCLLVLKNLTISIVGCLLVVWGDLSAESPTPALVIKIGVILPLTGVGALPASNAQNALILAKEEFENSSNVKIQLLFEDSKTDSKTSVAAYNKLATLNKVDAVIGDLWDFLVVPIVPLSKRYKLVTISPTVMDILGDNFNSSEYFWTLGSRVSSLDIPTKRFLDLFPDKKTVGIFCWSNYWGEAHLARWKKVVSDNNRSIIAEECEKDFGSDLRALTFKIHQIKPELIIASTIIGTFAKRLSELRSDAKILSTSDMLEELNNQGFDKKLVEGWYFTQWEDPKDFSKRYHERFGLLPLHEASKSYYALKALLSAFNNKRPEQSLIEALRGVKFKKSDGDQIDFANQPFANDTSAKLFRVENGKIVEIN